MDTKQNFTGGDASSNLSQYFANDPPSFFDDLAPSRQIEILANNTAQKTQKQPPPLIPAAQAAPATHVSHLTTNTYNGGFQPPEYIEHNPDAVEDEFKVTDDVRNMWETPQNEHGMPPMLTMPGIHSPNDLADPIATAVIKHLGNAELANRNILNAEQVTQDERGLRRLIYAGCYRAAVNLTGRLLTVYGQGFGRVGQPAKHSPHSLQLWFTRLALLAKLGEFELLQAEAEPFDQLNRPDVFYQFYPEMHNGKTGSIACFSFRVLLAELPIYLGKPQVALDRLSEVYVICSEIRKHYEAQDANIASSLFWRKREERVLHSIVNCALMMKKYNMIDDIISGLLLTRKELTKEQSRALYSAWGRIYLQIGDIFGAEQKFAVARRLREMNSAPDLRDLVDKGLITVAKNDFPEAYAIFQKALHLESGNTMILNNMGVCLLYAGKLKDAINLYERAINLNPQKSLNESLLVNLSTLYELESNNSKTKKLNLLRLINRYKPDLNISMELCLKLQATN